MAGQFDRFQQSRPRRQPSREAHIRPGCRPLVVGLDLEWAWHIAGWNCTGFHPPESFWVRVFVGPIVFTIAVYFCWRGFAAAVDAVSGAVAVTSGTLYKRWDSDDDAPWQGAGYYYVGVGGVERKLYKSAGERVPVGIYCRAYYAYGSNRLLSVEPAASVDEYAFDPTGKTWARVRRGGVTAIVGIFCLVVGSGYVVAGDPNRRIDSTVAGVLLLLVGGILLSAIAWRILRKGRGGQTS